MAETTPHAGARPPHSGARRVAHPALVLLVIAGAQLMVVLDGTIVNIALPSMGRYFDKGQTDITWALNAYTLAFGGLLLLGGRMGDVLGRRRMFGIGLALFTLGSFLAGIAPGTDFFWFMLMGRAVQGVGGAIASPTALSLITTEFEEGPARNRAIAVYAAVSGAGAALGLLLGGVLTEYLSWRWVLFVNVPIGLLLITGAFLYLHESERLRGRFDVVGALLSVAGMVATVYGFIHVARDGWGNTETVVVFVAAVLLLGGFLFFEAKVAAEPMMPMRIFENRNRGGAYLVMFVAGAAMFGLFFYVTFFVQGVRDFSALKTGFGFLPVAFIIGIVSQVVARLIGKAGPKPLIVAGTVFLSAAMFWFSQVDAGSGYWGVLLPGMLALAAGMGCLFVPLTLTAVSGVQNTDAGLASALLNVGQQVGGALGLAILTTVFGTSTRNYAADNSAGLYKSLVQSVGGDQQLAGTVGAAIRNAKSGLQPEDIGKLVAAAPSDRQQGLRSFFDGPYHDFVHGLIAHGSGQAFLTGGFFGIVALIAAVALINVRRADLPTGGPGAPVAAAH